MNIEEDILKAKYFPQGSRDRLRAIMISLLIYLPGIAMIWDIYESVQYGYTTMAIIECISMLILYAFYLLFPRYIDGDTISHIALAVFTTFLFLSFYIPDKDPALSFFWMATLPILSFFYLGQQKGIIWTIVISVVFFILLIFDFLGWLVPQHSVVLLMQILFGYLSVSYILYVVEKERSMYEQNLNRSLKNNKLLFQELHHRTKNNLQVIIGLLESQTLTIEDSKYKQMFHAHADRIKSMSFVHENLYKGTTEDKVDMRKYLNDILDNLQKVTKYTIQMDVEEVFFNVKEGVSIGLIVNEAVTNVIEHAYMIDGDIINVSLQCEASKCTLHVGDSGVGFNDNKEYNSLGMALIEDLSAELLHGKLDILINNGTNIYVYFEREGNY